MFYSKIKYPNCGCYVYYFLKGINFSSLDLGSAVPSMTTSYLNEMTILKPTQNVIMKFDIYLKMILEIVYSKNDQSDKLNKLNDLLLSKLATI